MPIAKYFAALWVGSDGKGINKRFKHELHDTFGDIEYERFPQVVGHAIFAGTMALEAPSITSSTSSTTTIDITWNTPISSGFGSYLIKYQGQNVDLVEKSAVVEPLITMAALSNLVPGETYSITVAAVNGTRMATSTPVAVTTKLNQPEIASLSNTNDTITVNWLDPSGYIEQYMITFNGQNIDTALMAITRPGTSRNAVLPGLAAGETYSIVVTARSGVERADSLAVLKTTVPNVPTINSLVSTLTTITVTWVSPDLDYVESYKISYHGMYVDTTLKNVTVNSPTVTTTLNGLNSGDTYIIEVTAMSGTESAPSGAAQKTTKLNKPIVTLASRTTTTLTISWETDTSYVESIQVAYIGHNTDTEHRNVTVMGNNYIIVMRELTPGETYTIMATAISGLEIAISDSIIETTYLNNPTITVLLPTNTTLLIAWTSPESDFVESYLVTYAGDAGSTQMVSGDVRQVILTDLMPGGTYAVTVVAKSGAQTAPSLGKITTTFPNKPVIVSTFSLGTSTISITWQSPPQDILRAYELHYTGQNVDRTRREMVVPSTTTSFNLTSLRAGETYSLTVTAQTSGAVEDRRAVSDAVLKTTALNAPSINLITSTSTAMKIVWSSISFDYVEQYTLRLLERNSNTTKLTDTVVDGSQNLAVVSGLMPGQTYNVTVIANSSSVYATSASSEETLKPVSVQLREKGSTKDSVTVEWDPPVGIVDYYTVTCSYGMPLLDRINYSVAITMASCTDLPHPGNDYPISVISYSKGKTSEPSTKVLTALPDGVNLTESSSTTSSVKATWVAPLGVTDMFIIRCDPPDEATPSPASIQFTPGITKYSAECVNLAGPGKIYTMTVTTVSGLKNSQSSTIQLTALPEVVADLSATVVQTNTVILSWRKDPSCPNCDYDSFLATHTPESPGSPTQIPELSNEDYYVTSFGGLVPGKLYTFEVQSERNGKLSRSIALVQRTRPAQVSISLPPTIANSSIFLNWTPAEGITDRYHVTMSPNEGAVSLLADLSNPGASITMLSPGKNYNISVVTISGDVESDPTYYSFITQSYTPGPVLNVAVSPVYKHSVRVTFDPPDQPNGAIESYTVIFLGTAMRRGNHIGTVSSQDSLSVIIDRLKPGFRYVFTVLAVNDYGPGQQTQSQSIYLPVYPPDIPTKADGSPIIPKAAEGTSAGTVIASTSTITVVLKENIFRHDKGELLLYTIIVAEEGGVNTYQPGTGTTVAIGKSSAPSKSWMGVRNISPCPPYQAFEPRAYPFPPKDSSSSRKKRSSDNSVYIVIGNESCSGRSGYCNGPLKDDTSYVFHFRVFNAAGYADTAFSEPIQTDKDSTLALALGLATCFTLVILAIAVLAILLHLKKKRSRRYSESAKHGNENKGFEVEVPALNNKALSLKKKKSSRPVQLSEFLSHYNAMKADSEYLFSEEYEDLKNVGRSQPVEAAILLQNRSKNRFANIQPYDHTRVKLMPIDDEEGSDYINANYMPGYHSPREFIACQGTLPDTEDDMWRMIWEQKVETIVMVTQLVEKGRVKCHRYWPDQGKPRFYGDIQVAMMSEHELKHWTIREFTQQMGGKIRTIEHFNFTSWPDHGVPETTEVLLSFVKMVRKHISRTKGTYIPTVIHCSAGVGRTGTFIALDRLMQHMKEHDYVDIFGIVSEMRMHRNHMVQTEQQYVFIHECVIDLLQRRVSNSNVNYNMEVDEHYL